MSHDIEYASAVREQWLQPENQDKQENLEACTHAIGREFESRTLASLVNQSVRRWRAPPTNCAFDVLAVLDLEGKPEDGGVVEFPVLLLHTKSMQELGRFQRWVRLESKSFPLDVTERSLATPFGQVLAEFKDWMGGFGLNLHKPDHTFAFVTCGDWDLNKAIPAEHQMCGGIEVLGELPVSFCAWINMKVVYNAFHGTSITGMRGALARMKLLDEQGRPKHGFHHLGMHDVENIARVMVHLLGLDAAIDITMSNTSSIRSKCFQADALHQGESIELYW